MNVSIIVAPREKLSPTSQSLQSLRKTMDSDDQLIISLPSDFLAQVDTTLINELKQEGAQIYAHDTFIPPHQARGECIALTKHDWIVFCDNDIEYDENWLTELKKHITTENVDVVAPLIFIGPPAFEVIHHAGGQLVFKTDDVDEHHRMMNKRWSDVVIKNEVESEEYKRCEIGEFHCLAIRKAIFDDGVTLPAELITREQLDFALQMREKNLKVGFCHRSKVTYMAKSQFTKSDLAYHLERWSHDRAVASLDYCDQRWNVAINRTKILHDWIGMHRRRAALSYLKRFKLVSLLPWRMQIFLLQTVTGLKV